MTKSPIEKILKVIRGVEKLSGLKIVWKNVSGHAEEGAPFQASLHCNPFCEKVKTQAKQIDKCREDDCVNVKIKSVRKQSFFLKKCHAGVIEFIFPLFSRGYYDGALFVGPMKLSNKCPYDFCQKEYEDLPVFHRRDFHAIKDILSILLLYIRENKEFWELQNITETVSNNKIMAAIQFIRNNPDCDLTVAMLAEHCDLSESRFIHLFKEQVGMTFSEFLQKEKIERAKKMLAGSNLKITEISQRVGFAKQSYFGLVFKKCTGITPGRYRKETLARQNP